MSIKAELHNLLRWIAHCFHLHSIGQLPTADTNSHPSGVTLPAPPAAPPVAPPASSSVQMNNPVTATTPIATSIPPPSQALPPTPVPVAEPVISPPLVSAPVTVPTTAPVTAPAPAAAVIATPEPTPILAVPAASLPPADPPSQWTARGLSPTTNGKGAVRVQAIENATDKPANCAEWYIIEAVLTDPTYHLTDDEVFQIKSNLLEAFSLVADNGGVAPQFDGRQCNEAYEMLKPEPGSPQALGFGYVRGAPLTDTVSFIGTNIVGGVVQFASPTPEDIAAHFVANCRAVNAHGHHTGVWPVILHQSGPVAT